MKVRAVKSWKHNLDDGTSYWITPGDEFELDDPLPYLEAGLVVPSRKSEIETAIRKAPETQVTR